MPIRARPLSPADAHARWGWILWSFRGDLPGATESANAALRLDDKCAEAYLLRGVVSAARKANPEAEQDLRYAHLLAPRDARMIRALGLHLLFSSDWKTSRRVPVEVDALAEAIRPYSNTTAASLFLAIWELFHARPERAVNEATRAIRHDPACTPCYMIGGLATAAAGDRAGGERMLRTALAVASEPERPGVARLLETLDSAAKELQYP
jgi:Flp pilus assembly protein TadD